MTTRELPERRPNKIDIDLLPKEYQPRKTSKLSLALVITAIVLVCLIAPLIILKNDVSAQIGPLENELSQRNAEIGELNQQKQEAKALQTQIDTKEGQIEILEQDYLTFQDNIILWSEIIEEIDELMPGRRIKLNSIWQSGSEVLLEGTATKKIYVADFVKDLQESEYFSTADFNFEDCISMEGCNFTITTTLTK